MIEIWLVGPELKGNVVNIYMLVTSVVLSAEHQRVNDRQKELELCNQLARRLGSMDVTDQKVENPPL